MRPASLRNLDPRVSAERNRQRLSRCLDRLVAKMEPSGHVPPFEWLSLPDAAAALSFDVTTFVRLHLFRFDLRCDVRFAVEIARDPLSRRDHFVVRADQVAKVKRRMSPNPQRGAQR